MLNNVVGDFEVMRFTQPGSQSNVSTSGRTVAIPNAEDGNPARWVYVSAHKNLWMKFGQAGVTNTVGNGLHLLTNSYFAMHCQGFTHIGVDSRAGARQFALTPLENGPQTLASPMKWVADGSVVASAGGLVQTALPVGASGARARFYYVFGFDDNLHVMPSYGATSVSVTTGMRLCLTTPVMLDLAGFTHLAHIADSSGTLAIIPMENASTGGPALKSPMKFSPNTALTLTVAVSPSTSVQVIPPNSQGEIRYYYVCAGDLASDEPVFLQPGASAAEATPSLTTSLPFYYAAPMVIDLSGFTHIGAMVSAGASRNLCIAPLENQ